MYDSHILGRKTLRLKVVPRVDVGGVVGSGGGPAANPISGGGVVIRVVTSAIFGSFTTQSVSTTTNGGQPDAAFVRLARVA